MKIRKCFVSNSSSSSFIIDSEKHGKYFHQIINIMKKIPDGMIDYCLINFNDIIDIKNLYKVFDDEEVYCSIGRWINDDIKVKTIQFYNSTKLLKYLDNNLIDNIERIHCSFYDSCDIGDYANSIYKQLKDTGIEFTWYGK